MKLALLALVCVAAVFAAPPSNDASAQILHSNFDQSPEGGYVFGFETENGLKRDETGELKQALDEEKKPHDVVIVKGTYSYNNEEGKVQTINYFADETGYHAEGNSIPVGLPKAH